MVGVRSPPPKPLKAGAMPGADGLGLIPGSVCGASNGGERSKTVGQVHTRLGSRLLAFEDRQLLAEGGDFTPRPRVPKLAPRSHVPVR